MMRNDYGFPMEQRTGYCNYQEKVREFAVASMYTSEISQGLIKYPDIYPKGCT